MTSTKAKKSAKPATPASAATGLIVLGFDARQKPCGARFVDAAHVIHASSIAVSREHRRAKTDRLDTDLLKRAFLLCHEDAKASCYTKDEGRPLGAGHVGGGFKQPCAASAKSRGGERHGKVVN